MKIDLNNLSIGYVSSRSVVKIQNQLSESIRGGEYTCLLGPNGAGKTTLLRTLAGFLSPVDGAVYINGSDLSSLSQAEISKVLGVVLTERPSVSSMTVRQLVGLGRSPYTGFWGRLSGKDERVVDTALSLTGVTELQDRLVDTLSDGERQKVMIAKALAQETDAIFLDEPTAFLDYPSKAETMLLLRSLAHERQMVIFQSTHDLNMALALADRLWLVDRQLGVEIGSPRELADSGVLQKYFSRPGIEFDPENIEFRVIKP